MTSILHSLELPLKPDDKHNLRIKADDALVLLVKAIDDVIVTGKR